MELYLQSVQGIEGGNLIARRLTRLCMCGCHLNFEVRQL